MKKEPVLEPTKDGSPEVKSAVKGLVDLDQFEVSKKQQLPEEKLLVLTDTLQRLQAEFDNYRKRTEKQQQEFMKFATKELFKDVLPILDHFKLALLNTTKHDEFVAGVELIYSQFTELLKNNGIELIQAKGQKFDPTLHEALLQEDSEEQQGIILEELQPGYVMHGQILRPTKVKVAK